MSVVFSHRFFKVKAGVKASRLSLWSQIGAAGPFTNSKGQPLEDLSMKCVCNSISDKTDAAEVDYYTMQVFTPPECHQSRFFDIVKYPKAVPCDGTFSSESQPNGRKTSELFQSYADEGLDIDKVRTASVLEASNGIPAGLATVTQLISEYLNRNDSTEWQQMLVWPFFTRETDSCREKNVTSIAYPRLSYPPYVFGGIREAASSSASPIHRDYTKGNH